MEWGTGARGQRMGVWHRKRIATSLEPGHTCDHRSPLQDRHPVSGHTHLADWQRSPFINKVAYTVPSTS